MTSEWWGGGPSAGRPNAAAMLVVVLLLCALTVATFWPVLDRLDDAILGPPEDNMQCYWYLWYGAEAVARGDRDLMRTTLMFHPGGTSLWWAPYFYFGIPFGVLLGPLIPLPAVFNLVILLSFVLSGVGAYLLCLRLTGRPAASLLGAFVFAWNPSHFAHSLHHAGVAAIQWIPFFVLFLVRAEESGRDRDRVLAGAFLALAALCDWSYLVYGTLFLLVFTAHRSIRGGGSERRAAGRTLLVASIGAAVLLAPWLVPMVRIAMAHAGAAMAPPGHDTYVADLASLLVPPAEHALGDTAAVMAVNRRLTGNAWESTAYLGWMNLLLVAAYARELWRTSSFWLVSGVLFLALATGRSLHVLGVDTGMPMPWAAFADLPLVRHARAPSRVLPFAYLCFAVLVARAAAASLETRPPRSPARVAAAGAIATLIVLDFFAFARSVTSVELPAGFETILADPELEGAPGKAPFAILEVPWEGSRSLLYQTQHGVPLVHGFLIRRSEPALLDRLTFAPERIAEESRELVRNHVKYAVVYKSRLDRGLDPVADARHASASQWMARQWGSLHERVFEDERMIVFRLYRDAGLRERGS